MALSITKGDGVVVFSMNADSKSSCPLFFQLLGTLCCSPVCVVSHGLKRLLGGIQPALGTVQIMVGLFYVGIGSIVTASTGGSFFMWTGAPYWLGGLFLVSGIMCILADRFPSPCMVFLNILMNLVGTILALTAIGLYLEDLIMGFQIQWVCQDRYQFRNSGYGMGTISPEQTGIVEGNFQVCRSSKQVLMILLWGMEIFLIVFGILQFCVTISVSVLSIKALAKNAKEGKQDPELRKPLLEEVIANPAA